MKKFEYLSEIMLLGNEPHRLNDLGKEGWKLMHCQSDNEVREMLHYTFMREVDSSNPVEEVPFDYNVPKAQKQKLTHGSVANVTMPVRVLFTHSDEIPCDWDEEGNVLEVKSGLVMEVLPMKKMVYKGEEAQLLYQTM